MAKIAAGFLMYRIKNKKLEVYLCHPGGPYCANKDEGCWSVPKGEPEPGEEMLQTAMREFKEETGITPGKKFVPLGSIKQSNGKIVHAWAFEKNEDPPAIPQSNLCEIEWPPRSGKKCQIPEIDKAEFFNVEIARKKIRSAQLPFIERLQQALPPAFC